MKTINHDKITIIIGICAVVLTIAACSELLPWISDSDEDCENNCVEDTTMIIGCDNRTVIPEDLDSTTEEPWNFTGRFYKAVEEGIGSFCSGTLITDRFVLTAAHCVYDKGDDQLGFALAQKLVNQRPFGTHGVSRVYVPTSFIGGGDDEVTRAYDYAIAELVEPIEGAIPAGWGHVDWDILRAKPVFTVGYPGTPPDNGLEERPWITDGEYHTEQPFGWLDEGEAGLLYTDLDGSGGQSGSPVYSLLLPSQHEGQGVIRKVSGVLIGSPEEACLLQDQNWAARLTPGAVEHIENAMSPNTNNMFWEIINIPTSPTSGPGEPWP